MTAIFQPLDQGIIAALKMKYRSKLLENLFLNADKFSQLQLLAKQLPTGCTGLDYGCPAHIADAVTILKQVWDDMSPAVISGCWHHSHCLPVLNELEITGMCSYHKTLKTDIVMSMCNLFSNLNLKDSNVHEMLTTMGFDTHVKKVDELKDMASKALEKWLDVEEMAILDVDEDNDGDDSDSVSQVEPLDKVKLLKTLIPLLHEVHSIGTKVEDNVIIDMARNVCVHILDIV